MSGYLLELIEVPWALSPSEPAVSVEASEDGVEVGCLGACFFPGIYEQTRDWEESTPIVRIRLRFPAANQVRFTVAANRDAGPLQSADFDSSQIPGEQLFQRNPHLYLGQRKAYWESTGVCPDPGFYRFMDGKGQNYFLLDAKYYAVTIRADEYVEVGIARLKD